MRAIPETRYARTSDGVHLAYQVVGEGPIDILDCGVHWWHLEYQWTEPHWRRYLERLSRLGRLILFDKRGLGLSDRVGAEQTASLEHRVDDVQTILDVVGSERAVLHGGNFGAQLALVFAATVPQRVDALVLYSAMARLVRSDDYPFGVTEEQAQATVRRVEERWHEPFALNLVAPSKVDDPETREWWTTMQRLSASPGAAVALMRTAFATDIRHVLPMIQQPTLLVHRTGDRLIDISHGRYIAERVPSSRLVELDGSDMFFRSFDDVGDLVEEFITGRPASPEPDRVLATVVFTDIVDSTARAAAIGDREWRALLDRHDALVTRALVQHRGRLVKMTGDGILALFDGPGRALRCAAAILDGLSGLGLSGRAAAHTGEVDLRGDDVGGLAVSIASRVLSWAPPGEVLVSRTVTDLVAGSGFRFEARGVHDLKGVPGEWPLFAAFV